MTPGKLFNQAIAIVGRQGFEVRYEHLGGNGTGYCRVGTRQWVVIDVAQPVEEQLEQLARAIGSQPLPAGTELPEELRTLVQRCAAR